MMDNTIQKIAEAIDDDPIKQPRPAKTKPVSSPKEKERWIRNQMAKFRTIQTLEELVAFTDGLDVKATVNRDDYDRIVEQRKALEQAVNTTYNNLKTITGQEDIGTKLDPTGKYQRQDLYKLSRADPRFAEAFNQYDKAEEAYRVHDEYETKIVNQIKKHLTSGDNDLVMALDRRYESRFEPDDETSDPYQAIKTQEIARGAADRENFPEEGEEGYIPPAKAKFPIVKHWKDYFSHNPNEYVFVAYSGLGGQRTVRQIKLREIHERMLDRRLPDLEILAQIDKDDAELMKSSNVQFRKPENLIDWINTSGVTFNNLMDQASDIQEVEAVIDRWPDLWIQFHQYDENNQSHLEEIKTATKKLFESYLNKYRDVTNEIKKLLDEEDSEDVKSLLTILSMASKPVLEANVMPGSPPRYKFSYDEEDKYSTSTFEFCTQKGRPEKSYQILDPWPIGWQTPGQPLKVTYNDDGNAYEDEFTPEEIYTQNLANCLIDFRITNQTTPELGEEGDVDFQSSIQIYSNDPGYEPGHELNSGTPIIRPWSSNNKLDPYERITLQFDDPVTYETRQVQNVTRKEVWESALLDLPGSIILGLTKQPNAIAIQAREDYSVKYLSPAQLGKYSKSRHVQKKFIFPKANECLDDNGQAQVGFIQLTMEGMAEEGLGYRDLVPPGEAWKESEQVGRTKKWVETRLTTDRKRKYKAPDIDYSQRYSTALELDQNNEQLPDDLKDFRGEDGRLLSWMKDGYLETPYGDRLKIKSHGAHHTVDFPSRKFGAEEREIYRDIPLRRAVDLIDRLWFDYGFKSNSIAIPRADGTVLATVVTDANGFKSVNYPVAEGSGRTTLTLKAALNKAAEDAESFKERGKTKAKIGFCFAEIPSPNRTLRTMEINKKRGLPDHICGRTAAHLFYPPTLTGEPGSWELEPGDPVDPTSDGTYQSYQGLCDRHYLKHFEIMPQTVLDQMKADLIDVQEGPIVGGEAMRITSSNPPREGGVAKLGDPAYDQDEVKAEIRSQVIQFLQKWFGDESWLNVLGEFVANSDLAEGKDAKTRGAKIQLLDRMKNLYQDLFAMIASTIAIDAQFSDEGVQYYPIDPGSEQDLLSAGRWTEEEYPEDVGIADGMPFLYHAFKPIYAMLYNYFMAQWRRGMKPGERDILPFAELTAADVRRRGQLRAALRDQRFPSIGRPSPRIQGVKRPKKPYQESLESGLDDLISEAREIDDVIREIGRLL